MRSWNSDQNFIGLTDGSVTKARAMVRVPESERWQGGNLLKIPGTPTTMHATNLDLIEEERDPIGDRAVIGTMGQMQTAHIIAGCQSLNVTLCATGIQTVVEMRSPQTGRTHPGQKP